MKKINNYMFIVLIVLIATFLLYQKGYILTEYESISPKEAASLIENSDGNVTILDVRTPQEYRQDGHLIHSILVPLSELSTKLPALQAYKDTKIIVYCRSGNRSANASRVLSDAGFHVYNISGGINKWKSEHLSVETIRLGR